jgi:hypothetical protein
MATLAPRDLKGWERKRELNVMGGAEIMELVAPLI